MISELSRMTLQDGDVVILKCKLSDAVEITNMLLQGKRIVVVNIRPHESIEVLGRVDAIEILEQIVWERDVDDNT